MTIINGGLINCGTAASSSSSSLALSDGLACFTGSFSGVTTTSISHNLNSSNLVVEFKDATGNLLIPDTWSVTNANVIEAEFTPAATGNVTIIACIESGLAPITGGVTTIEGLSGIVDLDSPNNSIVITTSGQVINLNAIFTPASGAVLEQKCRDITILSGLIGTGGGGGVASINNISGIVTLTSTNNGLEIGVNGQSIEFTPLFTYASGQLVDQNTQDILTVSGLLGGGDAGQTSINGLSGALQLTSPDESILIGDNGQAIELSGLFTPASGVRVNQQLHEKRWQGVISGLQLSVNATNSGLFDISEGVAYVSGIRVVSPVMSGLDPEFPPPGSGDSCIYTTIGLDYNGNIIKRQGAVFDHDVLTRTVAIGTVLSGDAETPASGFIQVIHSENYNILNEDMNEISWMHSIMGSLVASGMQALEVPTLQLAITEGIFYDEGRGRHTIASQNPLEFLEIYNDASGFLRIQGSSSTIRNDVYDDGFGLEPLIGNRFASHTLWYNHIRDQWFLVISKGDYASLQLAEEAPLDRGCMVDHGDVMPIAKIVVQRASTALNGDAGRIVDKRRIVGGREAGGSSSTVTSTATTLQQAYDNSSVTEITVDVTRGALTVANDTVPLCAFGLKTFEVTDNAKEVEYFGVCASGFVTPSGHIRGALQIAIDPVGPPRCSLDVSGLICSSGLEIVHERPTVSGIGLATLADVFDAGQTSINGLSGVLNLTSPDGSILIGDGSQAIHLSGLFTAASGATLQQKCEDVLTLSGTVTQNTADINGVDTRLISLSGLTDGLPRTQTSLNGLSGVLLLDSPDGTILIGQDGQTIELSGLFTQASGAVLEQHTTDLVTLSGLIGSGGGGGGGTSINGISGTIDLVSPDGSVGIAVNGQNIELTVDTSGACSVGEFTPADGTLFTVAHGLNTEDFTWSMWRTDTDPHTTMIANVAASGFNHAVIQLDTPVNGKVVIQGCSASGTRTDVIATRTVASHYTATFLDSLIVVDASSAPVTVSLPTPSGNSGHTFYVKKIDAAANAVTINGNGSGLIDLASTAVIAAQHDALRLTAHGGNWWIL